MPEIRLQCLSAESAAAVVNEVTRPADTVHTASQDSHDVVIGYHDIRFPMDVAEWAFEHGHCHDEDAARVIGDVQGGGRG
ncbi:hypothetical protein [Nonomuraea angiospora]|uniref:hypothetical protein n=1 Tax=Nonomuraea angiospora TaxID=46172 RepID=UPI0029ADAB89|nr:hypothetical protein [Nonomuraea angiospora]MDX3111545.1 hypothetical protein [Nonomuraea angiospora]